MTIDPETLMAYADGELGPIEAKRVEQAIALDPTLAGQVERHRALTASLRGAFAPFATGPVPPAVETLLRESAKVTPIGTRQAGRDRPLWIAAVAASLVAGFLAAPLLRPGGGDLTIENGQTMAQGELGRALDTQLASTQPRDSVTRIGVTFHDRARRLCRSFERGATTGIACAQGKDWAVQRLYGGSTAQTSDYRQAGSPAAAAMADAQAMMAGDPLDATAEAAAIAARR